MSEAAPAAAGVAAEKKRRLLRRIPTSVVLTMLGIALRAWLLPAISRQWVDRQKARDLDPACRRWPSPRKRDDAKTTSGPAADTNHVCRFSRGKHPPVRTSPERAASHHGPP